MRISYKSMTKLNSGLKLLIDEVKHDLKNSFDELNGLAQ